MKSDRNDRTRPPNASQDVGQLTLWSLRVDEVCDVLQTSADHGLTDHEAAVRLRRHGANQLRRIRSRSSWRILWDQFTSLIVLLLVAASSVAFATGEVTEGSAIVAVLFINATIGFVTERRAQRSMEALRDLGHTVSTVRRDGAVRTIPSSGLVPGDIVVLDAGDVPSADLRILESSRLQVDESALTGESVPVDKSEEPAAPEAALPERTSMVFKGTAVTCGSGEAVVVATGMNTELGRISSLVEDAEPETTPLEKRLDRLARRLIVLTLIVAALIAIVFAASGRGWFLAIEIGIALAVATFPEGLPIVATVALARGMWRMARRNALVERLSAVETLGSTTVILTDKTGTLTENRMTVVELSLGDREVFVDGTGLETSGSFRTGSRSFDAAEDPELGELLRVGVLCNNATLDESSPGQPVATGDPTEIALLVVAAKAGLRRSALLQHFPELDEIAFDPETKRMATLHSHGGAVVAAIKGAPEGLIESCVSFRTAEGVAPMSPSDREVWSSLAAEMAARGLRVLTIATAECASVEEFRFDGMVLLGLVGFLDPPRAHVRDAIDACREAGIRIVMVTGDHGATGRTVAEAVGLVDRDDDSGPSFVDARQLPPLAELSGPELDEVLAAPVIARATPRQKLELISLHQSRGEVVAMTGDGVNDAPALKKADIGVAMGKRGTQVAREAADMVLRDDEFGTIVHAVAHGRAIHANIRKFVVYLMSCNVSEILTVGLGTVVEGPIPLLPLQILFLNLVTDVFPALALGVCEGSPALMHQAPRDPDEPVLRRQHWHRIMVLGVVISVSVLLALWSAVAWLGLEDTEATTVAFLTLALAQLWHVFSMRDPRSGWLRNEVTRNRWVWAALVLCVALLLVAVFWSPFAEVLSISDPGPAGWTLALGASLLPLCVGQIGLLRREGRSPRS